MYFFDYTWFILIPGLIVSAIAQAQVTRNFNRYSEVPSSRRLSGAQAARSILNANGLSNVSLQAIRGNLTDHYDPRDKSISLSEGVVNSTSIAAVAVAAHETGHAIQDGRNYFPLRFRNAMVPVCNFTSQAAWPLFFIGLIFGGFSRTGSNIGYILMDVGILFFMIALLFYIITLPVEFNASHRALIQLEDQNLIDPGEKKAVKRVLSAAAMTYVASTFVAFLNLLRMLALRNRS